MNKHGNHRSRQAVDVIRVLQEALQTARATRFQGDRDLLMVTDTYASRLDPSSDLKNKLGCKLGFDATIPMKKPREGFVRGVTPVSERAKKALKL